MFINTQASLIRLEAIIEAERIITVSRRYAGLPASGLLTILAKEMEQEHQFWEGICFTIHVYV
jgi:hypothetical protein